MAFPTQKTYTIDFEPIGKRVQVEADKTLADAANIAGLDLVTSCNGLGICGSCKIRLIEGTLTAPTTEEKRKLSDADFLEGMRLACKAKPASDVRIHIPPASRTQGQQLQITGRQSQIQLQPVIKTIDLVIPPPALDDLLGDFERLQKHTAALGSEIETASLTLLRQIPVLLRKYNWQIRAVIRKKALVSILPQNTKAVGLAFDIGSTKIAAYWIDLQSGAILHQTGFMNPQIAYGEDVVNRITYANKGKDEYKRLHRALIESINVHIQSTCQSLGLIPDQIVDMVVVGNTIVHHLFCGLPVRSMGEAPYVPTIQQALSIPATELGIQVAAGAEIYLPPNIAAYVGADHSAALSATRLNELPQTICLIDIGTNTEISLLHQQKITACSCASGPAFEGAHIKDGMRAAPGAIEDVKISKDQITYSTIGHKNAIGICGSGILSAAAEMRKANILDQRGAFIKNHPLTHSEGRKTHLVLSEGRQGRPITINRADIHEIQLAKGAIRAGIEILCSKAGISPVAVDRYLIAGAFGTHLDLSSAIEIGMFPDVPLARYQQIGNAAGVGARELLINLPLRSKLERVTRQINYIELTAEPDFTNIYVNALKLEKKDKIYDEI